MSENLELWKKVEKTPPETITKIDTEDGKQLNSVPSIHRIKRATELFGLYGDKWGLKNSKHGVEAIFGNLVMATLDTTFFFTHENNVIEFEISNSLAIVSQHDGKTKVNHSYRKAIETDMITKALSRLGFNADIYTDGELVESEKGEVELSKDDLVQVGDILNDEKE